jgi:Outer membrane protein beta-barrel domain
LGDAFGSGAGPAGALGSGAGVAGVFGVAGGVERLGAGGNFTFLRGCCASGNTSGPFCPQPAAIEVKAIRIHTATVLMCQIIARGSEARPELLALEACPTQQPKGLETSMNRFPRAAFAILATAVLGASTAVAENPLGAYVGVGVGASNVGNNDYYDYGYYGGYHDNDVAWKAIAGVRPIPFAGAEVEWIDFGSGNGNNGYYGNNYYYSNSSSHPKAAVLYGMGYLPLPLPFLDVYGKLGVARLQTDITTYAYPSGYCPPPYSACSAPYSYRTDQWDTKFAWGAGVQGRWQDFAFRAEYERIDSQYGDPAAFTVSATWTF